MLRKIDVRPRDTGEIISVTKASSSKENFSSRPKISFAAITCLMKCSGMYINEELCCCSHYLHAMYCIALSLLNWMDLSRMVYVATGETTMSATLVTKLTFIWYQFWVYYLFMIEHFLIRKHYRKVILSFQRYFEAYERSFKRKRVTRLIYAYVCTGVLLSLLFAALQMVLCVVDALNESSPILKIIRPTGLNIKTYSIPYILLSSLNGFSKGVNCLSIFVNWMFFSVCIYCFCKEYQFIYDRLKDIVEMDADPKVVEERLEMLRKRHEEMTKVVSQSNAILKHFTFVTYAAGMPMTCSVLYGMITGQLDLSDTIFMLMCLVIINLQMILVTSVAAYLNSKVHKPLDGIFQLDLGKVTDKTVQLLTVFAARLTGPSIGIGVWDLFVIDKSTIMMIGGTLITYAVVVIQFKTDGQVSHISNNSSFIS
ncbi:hypothetical protein ACJMK2_036589 [Sinanodonta woodiana]|uniref:Gustatory receptor n=1 Tax=Sinanodonta woodiana TaxID=1069815 RepID=A0ABD3WJI9_SINWO